MEFAMQPAGLERLPFASIEPHAAGCWTAIHMKAKALPDAIADEQPTRLGTNQRRLLGIVCQRGCVTFWQRKRPVVLSLPPIKERLQWNPHPARLRTFVGGKPW